MITGVKVGLKFYKIVEQENVLHKYVSYQICRECWQSLSTPCLATDYLCWTWWLRRKALRVIELVQSAVDLPGRERNWTTSLHTWDGNSRCHFIRVYCVSNQNRVRQKECCSWPLCLHLCELSGVRWPQKPFRRPRGICFPTSKASSNVPSC